MTEGTMSRIRKAKAMSLFRVNVLFFLMDWNEGDLY